MDQQQQQQYPPPQQGYGYPPQEGGPPPQQMGAYPPQGGQYAPPPQQMMGGGGGDAIAALAPVTKFTIKQKFSLLEAATNAVGCGCCEQRNKYDVYDSNSGSHLFVVKEESETCMRCCCNPAHALTLNIFDASNNQQVALIDRPFKYGCCWAWLECCLDEATLYRGPNKSGTPMGMTKQPICGGQCKPTMYSYTGSNFPEGGATEEGSFAKIQGPTCCFGGCTELCCDQEFKVTDAQEGNMAMIVKEKPSGAMGFLKEATNDADIFSLTLQKEISPDDKMVLLSSLLLVDYLFFEEGGMIECDGESVTCICCYCFCQGCFCPFKCTCSGGDD